MIEVKSAERVGTDVGLGIRRILRQRSDHLPRTRIRRFGRDENIRKKNRERRRKGAEQGANKAAAASESEPGNLPSHSLPTTLDRRRNPTTGTRHSYGPRSEEHTSEL